MTVGATLHVILNEESGATDKKADSERLADLFARSGANVRILLAESGDAVMQLTRQALAERGDTIVAGEATGRSGPVASLLVGSDRSLGVLPMGTFTACVAKKRSRLPDFLPSSDFADAELTLIIAYCLA